MPWAHQAHPVDACVLQCLPRTKSHTAIISVGLQHAYKMGTITQMLELIVLICASRLSLEALEKLRSFLQDYISSMCQHQDLNLCWV